MAAIIVGAMVRSRYSPTLLFAALFSVVTCVVYYRSLNTPFLFDDKPAIERNLSIRHLWPLGDVLSPPNTGAGVVGRPLANLSLALNYAWSGLDPRGYHATNVAIHILAGLSLWGVLRRTLRRIGGTVASEWVSGAATLAWLVHPLQTESVICVVQRNELLVGLFFLQALYGLIRATDSPGGRRWEILSVACCFAGMATKEVMATAPVVLALYDRIFLTGSWREMWRSRRWYYVGLASSWILLAVLMLRSEQRGGTVGFGLGLSPWSYLLTQCDAIATYLRLSIWPHPLIVDYGVDAASGLAAVWWQALLILALLALTVVALRRQPRLGFLGAWFFIILAPSSSFVPLTTQPIAEHRMYLPLAAVVVLLALLVSRLAAARKLVGSTIVAALAAISFARGADYRTALTLWTDTIAKRPANARAYASLGEALAQERRWDEAARAYEQALRLRPEYADAQSDYATVLMEAGRVDEAIRHYGDALKIRPGDPDIGVNLGLALARAGRVDEAIAQFKAVAGATPAHPAALKQLGHLLLQSSQPTPAIEWLSRAAAIAPGDGEVQADLGDALFQSGRFLEAARAYEVMAKLNPTVPEVRYNLANAWLQANRTTEAIAEYEATLRLKPDWPAAHYNLGLALLRSNRSAEAIGHFETALRELPNSAPVHHSLAQALAGAGRVGEAITHEETALRLQPDFADARRELEVLKRR